MHHERHILRTRAAVDQDVEASLALTSELFAPLMMFCVC